MAWIWDPQIWAGFAALTLLEIVLGVDNLVFLALLAGRLPPARRRSARAIGLAFALLMRLALLASVSWMVHLTAPLFVAAGREISWRDVILIAGGAFLLYKGTSEIHHEVDADPDGAPVDVKPAGFGATIAQIVMFDLVFSLDSVITAVGVAEHFGVMAGAIVVAMLLMLLASDPLAGFVERYASVKMLALSFLLLIGMTLVADGLGFHIPRGYVYAAMGFSVAVESLNLLARRNRVRRRNGS